jgi:hypothetical protein
MGQLAACQQGLCIHCAERYLLTQTLALNEIRRRTSSGASTNATSMQTEARADAVKFTREFS